MFFRILFKWSQSRISVWLIHKTRQSKLHLYTFYPSSCCLCMRRFCMFDDLQSVSVSYREWVVIQQQKRDAAQTHYHCDQWVLLHLFCALHRGVCVWDRARCHDADPGSGKGFTLLESWFWYVRQCCVHVSKKGKIFKKSSLKQTCSLCIHVVLKKKKIKKWCWSMGKCHVVQPSI